MAFEVDITKEQLYCDYKKDTQGKNVPVLQTTTPHIVYKKEEVLFGSLGTNFSSRLIYI